MSVETAPKTWGWTYFTAPPGQYDHVIPDGDMQEHDPTPHCWCSPNDEDEEGVMMHNSLDHREDYQLGRRKLN